MATFMEKDVLLELVQGKIAEYSTKSFNSGNINFSEDEYSDELKKLDKIYMEILKTNPEDIDFNKYVSEIKNAKNQRG